MRPRGGRLLASSGMLSILGIAVATYLTIVHYRVDSLVCGVSGGCHTVQSRKYAMVAGIPVAMLGLVMYVSLLALVLLKLKRADLNGPATYLAFGTSLAGVVYATYLTHIELYVIDASCQWFVASDAITTLICII